MRGNVMFIARRVAGDIFPSSGAGTVAAATAAGTAVRAGNATGATTVAAVTAAGTATAAAADVTWVGNKGASNNLTVTVDASSLNGDYARFIAFSTGTVQINNPTGTPLDAGSIELVNTTSRRMAAGGRFITGSGDTCVWEMASGTPLKVNSGVYRNVTTGVTHKGSSNSAGASLATIPAITDAAPGSMLQIDLQVNEGSSGPLVLDTTDIPGLTSWSSESSASATWYHARLALAAGTFAGGDIAWTVGGSPHSDIMVATWVVIR